MKKRSIQRSPNPKKPNQDLNVHTSIGMLKGKLKYTCSEDHMMTPKMGKSMKISIDNKSKCPKDIVDPIVVVNWIELALDKGLYSEEFDGNYPRYVWWKRIHDNEIQYFEARITNREIGEYKGYPLFKYEIENNRELINKLNSI